MKNNGISAMVRCLCGPLCMVVILLFGSMNALAQSFTDHPLMSGMAGTKLSSQKVLQFGVENVLVAGKYPAGARVGPYEGRVTDSWYQTTDGPIGEVKIYRNYLAAVQKMGGQQLNADFNPNHPVSLVTGTHVFTLGASPAAPILLLNITNGSRYQLKVIEPAVMEQSAQGGELAKEIKAKGFATLYINFDLNKADLKDDGLKAVKQIVQLMKDDGSLKLSIEGHTDNIGSASANKALSRDRAASVMREAVKHGVDAKRLSAEGFGAAVPVADNRTDEGRAKNRRVELVQIK